jgi:hypothetical protein
MAMQHIQLQNWAVARDLLKMARPLAPKDPYVLNEMAVLLLRTNEYTYTI